MWALFHSSFKHTLSTTLGYNPTAAAAVTAQAKARYKKIIARVPEFEPGDRFATNLVSCAMLGAFLLALDEKPSVEQVTDYYERAMMTPLMKWFCRMSGKAKFSAKDLRSMRQTAALRAADRNPYSWNMELHEYPDGSGYEARFTSCGICTLMTELGLYEFTPALCHLDYAMNAAAHGKARFVRSHTLASGGPYCDCGYKRK
jgi:hypothetical protein